MALHLRIEAGNVRSFRPTFVLPFGSYVSSSTGAEGSARRDETLYEDDLEADSLRLLGQI